jgi:tRNA(Ser,Leu) C12 N-acetylase TAN1
LAESQRRDAIRRQEAKEELERLNRRRAEREVEQRLREEEEIKMQRVAESAQMSDWIAKDGEFQLQQERTRAAIRIKEKRAKAVDFLALNLRYVHPVGEEEEEDAGLEIDLDEPYNILDVRIVYQWVVIGLSFEHRICPRIKWKNCMMTSSATFPSKILKLILISGLCVNIQFSPALR